MSVLSVLTINLVVLVVAFLLLWIFCIWLKDPTPIDAYWGIGMGVLATATFLQLPQPSTRSWILLLLCWVWAIRLGAYMLWRMHTQGPDRRYMRMLEKAKEQRGWGYAMATMMLVIVPQAPLQFIIGLPVQLGQIDSEPAALGALGWLGVVIAVLGFGFETVADMQLSSFRGRTENAGKVMSSGLWHYSRHPNYFGEACFWWGLFLIGAETAPGKFALISPILLTWLLIKWSGMPTMEYRMRKHKPGYLEYVERTSGFVPMPPRAPRVTAP